MLRVFCMYYAQPKACRRSFAFDAGIHRTYVSGAERGSRNPASTVVEQFANALEITVRELLDHHFHRDEQNFS